MHSNENKDIWQSGKAFYIFSIKPFSCYLVDTFWKSDDFVAFKKSEKYPELEMQGIIVKTGKTKTFFHNTVYSLVTKEVGLCIAFHEYSPRSKL